jgi:hypothetical protein
MALFTILTGVPMAAAISSLVRPWERLLSMVSSCREKSVGTGVSRFSYWAAARERFFA